MNILVTGGCGYVGSVLVPALLATGHRVRVVDAQWFGCYLDNAENLELIRADLREFDESWMTGIDTVVHLANVANDPGVDLNPLLSWEINVLATERLVRASAKHGVKHFLFASSGSVYGISDEDRVTEAVEPFPFSAYNKTKLIAERVALSYSNVMQVHAIRPATVCGLSPRMRFDVSVNMFCMQAIRDRELRVLGGSQVRPNIHIGDLVRVFSHFISNSELPSGSYNAGFENLSIMDLATMVADIAGVRVKVEESLDPRSYRLDSSLLLSTGFSPEFGVSIAIQEVVMALEQGAVLDRDEWYTIPTMKRVLSNDPA